MFSKYPAARMTPHTLTLRAQQVRFALAGAFLVLIAGLLFSRLGHYALWDDESFTALGAKGVMRTGDTSVMLDHNNIVACHEGIVVQGFCDRSTPPLATYLTAVSFSLFGMNAWTARLPFALLGLGMYVLILYWARRENLAVLAVLMIALLGNVSLILFFRQCRYYGPTIFLSVAIVFVYRRWNATPRTLLVLAGLSVLLFAAHYLDFLALYVCLAIDYIIWKRKEWPPTWRNGLLLFGPQLVLIGIITSIWNPLRTPYGSYEALNDFWDRVTLFFWYWWDMDQAEFLSLPVLLLVVVVGLVQRRTWLLRGCLAMVVFLTVIVALSPQPVRATSMADVRYAALLIPLAIALETGAICALLRQRILLCIGAALIVFGTNLTNGGPLVTGGFRSTLLSYLEELRDPPSEPYTPTANWINEHVPEGGSIWVEPDYMTYPLMFHAPRALYAWQLDWPPRADFTGLPMIHFIGQEPPDYIIAFGPGLNQVAQTIQTWNRPDVAYKQAATIPVFWKDLYRPELFWRTFQPITGFDPNSQAIYIFQRTAPPAK